MEYTSYDEEEAEEEDLKHQTTGDDSFAGFDLRGTGCFG